MFLQCKRRAEDNILEKVRSISGVAYAYSLENLYDIVVKVESDSIESFTSSIASIRNISDILNTDTMIGFKYRWDILLHLLQKHLLSLAPFR
jgi:nitrate reductase NapAB chaperone NapD